jgi:hypothetical protein
MPLYACRWSDEFVTFVYAKDETEATKALDEIGDPSGLELHNLHLADCVLTFRTDAEATLSLAPDEWQTDTLFQLRMFAFPDWEPSEDDED